MSERECFFCDGGHVDLFVSGEYQETMKCPDCNGTGIVSESEHLSMQDSVEALNVAFADEQYKY